MSFYSVYILSVPNLLHSYFTHTIKRSENGKQTEYLTDVYRKEPRGQYTTKDWYTNFVDHKVAYHYVYFTLFYAEFRKIGRDVHLDHFAKKEYCRKQRKKTGRFLTNQKVTYKGGNFCLTKKNFLPN